MSTKEELLERIEIIRKSYDEVVRFAQAEYLGKEGPLTELLDELKYLSDYDRRIVGQALNELKSHINR